MIHFSSFVLYVALGEQKLYDRRAVKMMNKIRPKQMLDTRINPARLFQTNEDAALGNKQYQLIYRELKNSVVYLVYVTKFSLPKYI